MNNENMFSKNNIEREPDPYGLHYLSGSHAVTDWFGYRPDFHDAEVISLALTRLGTSVLRVYPYDPQKPATVDFLLEEITDLSLEDFSHQNVINSLMVEKVITEEFGEVIRLNLAPCYGLTGRIDAKKVKVQVTPGKSPDGGSSW